MLSDTNILIYTLFKLLIILLGFILILLGHNLFSKGIILNAGDLEIKSKKSVLKLINATPGTYLFLIGGFIIIFSILKGLEFNKIAKSKKSENSSLNLITVDTTFAQIDVSNNVDSLILLGQKRYRENKFIEAFAFFYWAKGAIRTKNDSLLIPKLNNEIKLTKIELQKTFNNQNNEIYNEETNSIKITDESLDSSDH